MSFNDQIDRDHEDNQPRPRKDDPLTIPWVVLILGLAALALVGCLLGVLILRTT